MGDIENYETCEALLNVQQSGVETSLITIITVNDIELNV